MELTLLPLAMDLASLQLSLLHYCTCKTVHLKFFVQHILLCTTGDLDCSFSDPDSTDTPDDVLRAYVPPNVIWRGKKELAVKFLNDIPDDWTYAGSGMNIGNIMSWAKEWSLRGNGVIPNFILVEEPSARSNIRVKFTSELAAILKRSKWKTEG